MGIRFSRSVRIAPGSQFVGTEFSVAAQNNQKTLVVREIWLQMGAEAKDYSITKTRTIGGDVVSSLIRDEAASMDTDVVLSGQDADFILGAGSQIQFLTTGATSAMYAEVIYEEIDNTPELSFADRRARHG